MRQDRSHNLILQIRYGTDRQRRTPVSAANADMQANRPQIDLTRGCPGRNLPVSPSSRNHRYSLKEISAFRHAREVENSQRKREGTASCLTMTS